MRTAGMRAEAGPVLRLALPIVAGLSASMLLGVTDSLMLAPLGPVALAAAGLTTAVAMILYASIWGLLSVLAVRIGQARGAGRGRRVPFVLRNGLVLGLFVGTGGTALMGLAWPVLPHLGQPAEVLAAMPAYFAVIALVMVPYAVLTVFKFAFEAIGRGWTGTAFAMLAVVVNVPLNYALIWGLGPLPELGLLGAGVATLVAESVALAAAFACWAFAPSMRRLRLRRPLAWGEIGAAFREGAPLALLYVAETGATTVLALMIGTFGTAALAANQVAGAIGGVLYMVPLGIAGAVAIRVAEMDGAGRREAARPVVGAGLLIGMIWLGAAALALGFGGRAIAAAVTADPEVIGIAAAIFGVFALCQLADGLQSTMVGALRGLSDTAFPAAVSTLACWGLGLPLGWVLATAGGQGPAGVWLGWLAALVLAGLILVWRFLDRTPPLSAPCPAE